MWGIKSRGHKMMGRVACGAMALVATLALAGCSLLTPSRANEEPEATLTKLTTPTIATKGVLTVGLPSESAPLVMTDEEGQLTGYTVDVARALAKNLGLKVTFVTGARVGDTGGSAAPDIYLGATVDDADSAISVEGEFLQDAPAIFGRADVAASAGEDAPAISAETLSGATIAVQTGSAAQDTLAKCGINATQKACANVNDCLKAVASGEADYAAVGASSGSYLARAYKDVRLMGTIDDATAYGAAVRTMNADLAQAISDALSELASDGTLDAIHTAWFGATSRDLTGMLASGITTSAQRAAAEQEAKDAEDATDDADGVTSGDSEDGASTASTASSSTAGSGSYAATGAESTDSADASVPSDSPFAPGF